jgi:hypothetical protein
MTGKIYTLKPFMDSLSVAGTMGHRNLLLLPLGGTGKERFDYLLGVEALAAGRLRITEVDEGGSVPELLAENTADRMILLVDGEELVGAKQNRILNTSVLIPPGATVKIPVSCVEQGRWNATSDAFQVGGHSPSRLRARKSRDVTASLKREGVARSDQHAVWDEVAACLQDAETDSPTEALHDVIEHRQDALSGYVKALNYLPETRGVIVAINGRFAAADIFDRAGTLETLWPRLITGYALDAIGRKENTASTLTARGAGALLEHVAELACDVCPTVGFGEDWRFEAEDVVGQALVAEKTCVHLSIFPNEDHNQREHEPLEGYVAPPSHRRNHRHREGPPGIVY